MKTSSKGIGTHVKVHRARDKFPNTRLEDVDRLCGTWNKYLGTKAQNAIGKNNIL